MCVCLMGGGGAAEFLCLDQMYWTGIGKLNVAQFYSKCQESHSQAWPVVMA